MLLSIKEVKNHDYNTVSLCITNTKSYKKKDEIHRMDLDSERAILSNRIDPNQLPFTRTGLTTITAFLYTLARKTESSYSFFP